MRTGPRHDSLPLPVFSLICEHLCHLWIKIPSPDRKRAGPVLAAKRRKRRKKDGATELCLYYFKAGPKKSEGRSLDKNMEDRNIRSAERVWTHISVPIFLS